MVVMCCLSVSLPNIIILLVCSYGVRVEPHGEGVGMEKNYSHSTAMRMNSKSVTR